MPILGLTKMVLIGIVALVVLGPVRLLRVARMVGALFAHTQRYCNNVKAEVARELELEELRRIKTTFEKASQNIEIAIYNSLYKKEGELNNIFCMGGDCTPSAPNVVSHDANIGDMLWESSTEFTPKRKNWRIKQRRATPTWYKRAMVYHRTRIQSGAARVVRFTPISLRRPTRFF